MTNFRVLLFYKYILIPDAERFAAEHLAYCKELGIKGRILIADEGINGTLSGSIEQTEQYMRDLRSNPLFQDIVFKIDASDAHAFKKMFVRYRKELVTLRYDRPLDPNRDGGGRLRPSEFYAWLQREDVVVLDGADDTCHHQHLVCDDCLETKHGYCSTACEDHDHQQLMNR
ncbi:hypothetical protein PRECH8_25330 [Insulibacter thermoxylanivorax]|uniref:tRNA uridine(34) hydroxylase N-terminal domain-containing protein n=1 Tax=Insulibacter thermoxylanivorax TaxID=2749268 RepID=A0A916QIS7_9BACL|nr:hypothetical protein PRECH8_25330 [Insulibacter thermoxylanivorax]